MDLKGGTVLVTGGGTGIGRAVALACGRQGANVAVNYHRSRQEAERTVRDLQALEVQAFAVQADVSRDREVRAMVAEVMDRFGSLEVLVNNAGTTDFVPLENLESLTEQMWDSAFAVNAKGTFFCARAAAPIMRTNGGVIVNIASIAGMIGLGSSIAYCASKAAVISITKSLARGLAPHVRVNAVAPGFVDTRWTAGWDEFRAGHEASTPLGRVAAPEDVAEVVLSLITSAGFVTGQVVVVDGGRTM